MTEKQNLNYVEYSRKGSGRVDPDHPISSNLSEMPREALSYEELYKRLYDTGEGMHRSNKKRIRIGLAGFAVLTLALLFIRCLTDSDKVVFLIIWVIGMFIISAYLISVEYIDSRIQKTLEEVTERETRFGELIPDTGELQDRIHRRIEERIRERGDQLREIEIRPQRLQHSDRSSTAAESEDAE